MIAYVARSVINPWDRLPSQVAPWNVRLQYFWHGYYHRAGATYPPAHNLSAAQCRRQRVSVQSAYGLCVGLLQRAVLWLDTLSWLRCRLCMVAHGQLACVCTAIVTTLR